MKEKLTRRDFLGLVPSAIAAFSLPPWALSLEAPEYRENSTPEFRYVGPYIDCIRQGQSEGERAGWIDPDDPDRMIVGTWGHGIWKTLNGGKGWELVDIPTVENSYWGVPSVARDMVTIPETGEVLIVFDYSLALGSLDNSQWSCINLPTKSYVAQTVCVLPSGKILIGGFDSPQSKFTGMAVTDMRTMKNTIKYNKNHPDFPKDVRWKVIKDIFNWEYWSFIRTIAHLPTNDSGSPGKIFFGGWLGMSNNRSPGTGLICIDDKNFKPIEEYTFPFEQKVEGDIYGPMAINTIKALYYKGHEIVLIGGEGSGGGRNDNPERRHFQIVIDGEACPPDIVNCKGLIESGGGSDLIAAQRGIEVCQETSEVFVSTAFKEISRVSLENIISQRLLNWERITKAPEGQKDTGSFHIILSRNKARDSKPALMVCREVWGKGPFPFQQVALANLVP